MTNGMTVVKANYIKTKAHAKKNLRYIQHRKGKDGATITRTLFSSDGTMSRSQAYRMIDAAERGTRFYRIAISPSMETEDIHRDLHLRAIAEQTMLYLTEQFQQPIAYIATEHTEHAQHRHLHVLALLPRTLSKPELQSLRETATQAALLQRKARDLAQEQLRREREEERQWER